MLIGIAKALDWIDAHVLQHRIYSVCKVVADFYCWADKS